MGEGGYEGLIAIAQVTWQPDGGEVALEGVILDGELPPSPAIVLTE